MKVSGITVDKRMDTASSARVNASDQLTRLIRSVVVIALALALLGTYAERWGMANQGQPGDSTDPHIGQVAPPFEASALGGQSVRLDAFRGQVVVLNFWATWCGPCRGEMPELEAYGREHAGSVAIVGANVGESTETIAPYVEQVGITFPVLPGTDQQLANQYSVTALPSSIILDRQGVVRDRVIGPMTRDTLARHVEPLL